MGKVADEAGGAFGGRARDYDRYRLAYPAELVARVAGNHTGGRLVDLGTGTGTGTGALAIALAPSFAEVLGVDCDPGMLVVARERSNHLANVSWLLKRAEDLDLDRGTVEKVTIGSAFHWMDRGLVATKVRDWLTDTGEVHLFGSQSTWKSETAWQRHVRSILVQFAGEERRAGPARTFSEPVVTHEDVFRSAGFNVGVVRSVVPVTWTIEEFLGYLRSTSFAGVDCLRQVEEVLHKWSVTKVPIQDHSLSVARRCRYSKNFGAVYS